MRNDRNGPDDPPYCWILEKTNRRSELLAAETTIRAGRLEHRTELVQTLRMVIQLPDVSPRELARMITIARLLADADLLVELRQVEAVIGSPPRRRSGRGEE